jgi:hypothetical protein
MPRSYLVFSRSVNILKRTTAIQTLGEGREDGGAVCLSQGAMASRDRIIKDLGRGQEPIFRVSLGLTVRTALVPIRARTSPSTSAYP